jgi:hypothetical protein
MSADDIRAMFAAVYDRPDGTKAMWVGHRSQGGNYLPRMQAIPQEAITPGVVNIVTIAHDVGCLIWRTGYCNCDPDLSVAPAPPEGSR